MEQWRMEYMFLGTLVCREAFMALTGISAYMLQQCRGGAIRGQRSVLSAHEMGLHASIKNQAGGRSPTYLSARQWLEHYASTHAEMSPMDERAYLPSGRKIYYYYHYRRDMIQRGEASLGPLASIPEEAEAAPEEAELGSTPGLCSDPSLPPPPPPPPTRRHGEAVNGNARTGVLRWGVLPGKRRTTRKASSWLPRAHSWKLGG